MRALSGIWAVVLSITIVALVACGGGGGGGGTPSATCLAGEVRCGDHCVDPLTDRAYCGANASCASYTACPSGQVCGNGQCATSCPAGQVNCSGKCVDPLADRAYCGANASCAGYTACPSGQVCGNGQCATSCPAGQVNCSGKCVDPLADRAYCGADSSCAGYTTCASGQVCGNGQCATSCPAGQVNCSGKCVDPLTDRAYCGADASCAGYTTCPSGQVCGNGQCATSCPAGQVNCSGKCVDPLADRAYCGANASCAGYTTCPSGQVCGNGQCTTSCPTDQVNCSGKCVDPLTDRAYCGANASCAGYTTCPSGQVCGNGQCTGSCPQGQYACGGRCVDPLTDATYCGAAADCSGGATCGSGSFCDAGHCWSPCEAGQAFCDHVCVDPNTNRGRCGASGLCGGAASGARCAADHVCTSGHCACPAGQTECSGVCRFGSCGAATPGWEWKGNVALTRPPLFVAPPPTVVLAHIVFDGTNMVDLTDNTHWVPATVPPPSGTSGIWYPAQSYSGPFNSTTFWLGTAESRDYLASVTSKKFTVCARYRPGKFPLVGGTNKIVFALGKAEAMSSTPDAKLGGWALMQMHRSSCFHYYGQGLSEWMAPSPWAIEPEIAEPLEWTWQCGGWDGSTLVSLHDSAYSSYMMRNDNSNAPFALGFPIDLELPAIGAYPDGTAPLEDGQVYEMIITSDPATETTMKNLVARASGGLRLDNAVPVPFTGADGLTHYGSPGTPSIGPDGAAIGDQRILLGTTLPAGADPAANGQCWGIEATAARWDDLRFSTNSLLNWTSADGKQTATLSWAAQYVALDSGTRADWVRDALDDGTRHVFHACIDPDRKARLFVDGVQQGGPGPAFPEGMVPHLEDPYSSFTLGAVNEGLKIWRVFACEGFNPAACP